MEEETIESGTSWEELFEEEIREIRQALEETPEGETLRVYVCTKAEEEIRNERWEFGKEVVELIEGVIRRHYPEVAKLAKSLEGNRLLSGMAHDATVSAIRNRLTRLIAFEYEQAQRI